MTTILTSEISIVHEEQSFQVREPAINTPRKGEAVPEGRIPKLKPPLWWAC